MAVWMLLGRMEGQVGIGAWLAAMLFTLDPLRTLMPGTPPIGARIDVLVFFRSGSPRLQRYDRQGRFGRASPALG